MKRIAFFSFLLMTLAPTAVNAGGVDAFIGKWRVDYEATLKEAKNSPEYDPEKDGKIFPRVLRSIADQMIFELTDKEIVIRLGEKQNSMPYEVKSDKDGQVVLEYGGEENRKSTLTLEPRRKGRMSFKSSLTDDMDFYIWMPMELDEGRAK